MKKIILLVIFLLCIACSRQEKIEEHEVNYKHIGEFVSLVDQRKEPMAKDLKIKYTLQLKNFNPNESVFKIYHSQYQQENEEYKHIEITKGTKVFDLHDNKRKEVPVSNIENSKRLEVWIKPYHLSDYHIEALEIYILE